jgi:hypothetical protein
MDQPYSLVVLAAVLDLIVEMTQEELQQDPLVEVPIQFLLLLGGAIQVEIIQLEAQVLAAGVLVVLELKLLIHQIQPQEDLAEMDYSILLQEHQHIMLAAEVVVFFLEILVLLEVVDLVVVGTVEKILLVFPEQQIPVVVVVVAEGLRALFLRVPVVQVS